VEQAVLVQLSRRGPLRVRLDRQDAPAAATAHGNFSKRRLATAQLCSNCREDSGQSTRKCPLRLIALLLLSTDISSVPEVGEANGHACLVVLAGFDLLLQPELLKGVRDGFVALICGNIKGCGKFVSVAVGMYR
jgi:hypothetical protein